MSNQSKGQRVVLASRPAGPPEASNFRVEAFDLAEPKEGELLLKTLFLSLDPYMRMRMSEGDSYADPVAVNQEMCGGTVSRVEFSRHPNFNQGDLILGFTGWKSHAISDGTELNKLDPDMANPSWALSALGMPSFTAYFGLLELGQPKHGETVVVGAASGAVGSVVGQIAKIKGCRAVGIAGGPEKCRYVVEELGFDACIDHRADNFSAQLASACPDGIDVYFENVGGALLAAALPLLNVRARVPLCGIISWYDQDAKTDLGAPTASFMRTLLVKQIRIQGFLIIDYYHAHYGAFMKDMSGWLSEGKVKVREDITRGLDKAPETFLGMLRGRNFGKTIIEVASA